MTTPNRPFIIPGKSSAVQTVKPRKKKLDQPVDVGMAWTFWCPFCEDLCITFFEDVTFSEAKCDHCNQKVKLNLVDPGTVTPKMPGRKPAPEKESGIREVHFEPSRGVRSE